MKKTLLIGSLAFTLAAAPALAQVSSAYSNPNNGTYNNGSNSGQNVENGSNQNGSKANVNPNNQGFNNGNPNSNNGNQAFNAAQWQQPPSVQQADRAQMQFLMRNAIGQVWMANVAMQKSNDRAVKQYAQFIANDRQQLISTLENAARQKNVNLSERPAPADVVEIAYLDHFNGPLFDQQYLQASQTMERDSLAVTRDDLASTSDLQLRNFDQRVADQFSRHMGYAGQAMNQVALTEFASNNNVGFNQGNGSENGYQAAWNGTNANGNSSGFTTNPNQGSDTAAYLNPGAGNNPNGFGAQSNNQYAQNNKPNGQNNAQAPVASKPANGNGANGSGNASKHD